jgi:tetratricopeptide (TPR) repeat protein
MTEDNKYKKILEVALGALSVGVPLAAYVITLPRTITFEDSGQIITAAARLGVSHPSGYPLATLVGQAFTLAPWGRMAWRVNLASAATAAACCLVLFFLLRRLFLEIKAEARVAAAASAAGAAVAFGLSRTFWSQAVVAEAYAVNALALAVVLYAAFNFARGADARFGYLAAFASGLALAAHTSSAIVTLPAAVYLLWRFRRLPSPRALGLALALVLLGFMVYLYLPLRAVQGPAINWGDPRTLVRAYAHITRRMYGGPDVVRLQFLPHHLYELGKFVWRDFVPPAAFAMAAGLFLALKRRARPWGFLALLPLPTGPLATVALVLLLQGHQLPGIQVWYIPFFLLTTPFLGLALFSLATARRPWFRRAGYAAIALAAALPLASNFYWNDYRRYFFAEDYGANFLRTISYRGLNIMFERGSLGTFETAYLKKVEGYRPDHVFVDATGSVYSEYELFAAGRLNPSDPVAAQLWEQEFERGILNSPEQRHIYYSIFREVIASYGYALEPAGMLYRVTRPPVEPRPVSPVWGRYAMRGMAAVEANPGTPRNLAEEWIRDAACKYLTMHAREYFLAGENDKGFAALEAATPVAQGMTESLLELANIYITYAYFEEAIDMYDRAIAAFPRKGIGDDSLRYHYAQIWANRAIVYLYLGDVDAAEASFGESIKAYPDQPNIRRMMQRENMERAAESMAVRREKLTPRERE